MREGGSVPPLGGIDPQTGQVPDRQPGLAWQSCWLALSQPWSASCRPQHTHSHHTILFDNNDVIISMADVYFIHMHTHTHMWGFNCEREIDRRFCQALTAQLFPRIPVAVSKTALNLLLCSAMNQRLAIGVCMCVDPGKARQRPFVSFSLGRRFEIKRVESKVPFGFVQKQSDAWVRFFSLLSLPSPRSRGSSWPRVDPKGRGVQGGDVGRLKCRIDPRQTGPHW